MNKKILNKLNKDTLLFITNISINQFYSINLKSDMF